jgi:DNA-binding Xre family transcriptional regulator
MSISYNPLWKQLIDRKMSKADLRKLVQLSPNTLTKMRKGEPVALVILERICKELSLNFGDIIEYIPDEE